MAWVKLATLEEVKARIAENYDTVKAIADENRELFYLEELYKHGLEIGDTVILEDGTRGILEAMDGRHYWLWRKIKKDGTMAKQATHVVLGAHAPFTVIKKEA